MTQGSGAAESFRNPSQSRFKATPAYGKSARMSTRYFTAQVDSEQPYDKHLCRVNLKGGGLTRLTEASGDRLIQISPSKEFFLDLNGSLSRPPATELRRSDGKLLQVVTRANIDILKEQLQWSPPEGFKVKAADGQTDIYGVLFKPYNFDPGKKYPGHRLHL